MLLKKGETKNRPSVSPPLDELISMGFTSEDLFKLQVRADQEAKQREQARQSKAGSLPDAAPKPTPTNQDWELIFQKRQLEEKTGEQQTKVLASQVRQHEQKPPPARPLLNQPEHLPFHPTAKPKPATIRVEVLSFDEHRKKLGLPPQELGKPFATFIHRDTRTPPQKKFTLADVLGLKSKQDFHDAQRREELRQREHAKHPTLLFPFEQPIPIEQVSLQPPVASPQAEPELTLSSPPVSTAALVEAPPAVNQTLDETQLPITAASKPILMIDKEFLKAQRSRRLQETAAQPPLVSAPTEAIESPPVANAATSPVAPAQPELAPAPEVADEVVGAEAPTKAESATTIRTDKAYDEYREDAINQFSGENEVVVMDLLDQLRQAYIKAKAKMKQSLPTDIKEWFWSNLIKPLPNKHVELEEATAAYLNFMSIYAVERAVSLFPSPNLDNRQEMTEFFLNLVHTAINNLREEERVLCEKEAEFVGKQPFSEISRLIHNRPGTKFAIGILSGATASVLTQDAAMSLAAAPLLMGGLDGLLDKLRGGLTSRERRNMHRYVNSSLVVAEIEEEILGKGGSVDQLEQAYDKLIGNLKGGYYMDLKRILVNTCRRQTPKECADALIEGLKSKDALLSEKNKAAKNQTLLQRSQLAAAAVLVLMALGAGATPKKGIDALAEALHIKPDGTELVEKPPAVTPTATPTVVFEQPKAPEKDEGLDGLVNKIKDGATNFLGLGRK